VKSSLYLIFGFAAIGAINFIINRYFLKHDVILLFNLDFSKYLDIASTYEGIKRNGYLI